MTPAEGGVLPLSVGPERADPGAPVPSEDRRGRRVGEGVGVLAGDPDRAPAIERRGRVVAPTAHKGYRLTEARSVRGLTRLQQTTVARELGPGAGPDDEPRFRIDRADHPREDNR